MDSDRYNFLYVAAHELKVFASIDTYCPYFGKHYVKKEFIKVE